MRLLLGQSRLQLLGLAAIAAAILAEQFTLFDHFPNFAG